VVLSQQLSDFAPWILISAAKCVSDKVIWTDDDDTRLVSTLKDEKVVGYQAENGWKCVAWVAAEKVFEDDPPPKKTAAKSSDYWAHVCLLHCFSSIGIELDIAQMKSVFKIVQTL
jgi:hypothetical protein